MLQTIEMFQRAHFTPAFSLGRHFHCESSSKFVYSAAVTRTIHSLTGILQVGCYGKKRITIVIKSLNNTVVKMDRGILLRRNSCRNEINKSD